MITFMIAVLVLAIAIQAIAIMTHIPIDPNGNVVAPVESARASSGQRDAY
jgi:hypothetical protein